MKHLFSIKEAYDYFKIVANINKCSIFTQLLLEVKTKITIFDYKIPTKIIVQYFISRKYYFIRTFDICLTYTTMSIFVVLLAILYLLVLRPSDTGIKKISLKTSGKRMAGKNYI